MGVDLQCDLLPASVDWSAPSVATGSCHEEGSLSCPPSPERRRRGRALQPGPAERRGAPRHRASSRCSCCHQRRERTAWA